MPKKHKAKISKKIIKEKYPQKKDLGEDIVNFTTRLFLAFGIFIFIAISVDIYHFTH